LCKIKPTKPIFPWIYLLYIKISNSIYYKVWLFLGNYEKMVDFQNRYIRKLEDDSGCRKVSLGKAHYRLAQAHFRNDNLIEAIANCMIAIKTYKYSHRIVFRLCAKAYRILSLNCPHFEGKIFWNREIAKEKELIN